ncbi:MAG: peptidoglycan-binding domain-containing protein, partial [Oscillospiraceae bacterium]
AKLYPGIILEKGMENSYIYDLQSYLSVIGDTYTQVPKPNITGYFGDQTYNSVIAFQNLFGLNQTGAVGPIVWNKIAQLYDDIKGFND